MPASKSDAVVFACATRCQTIYCMYSHLSPWASRSLGVCGKKKKKEIIVPFELVAASISRIGGCGTNKQRIGIHSTDVCGTVRRGYYKMSCGVFSLRDKYTRCMCATMQISIGLTLAAYGSTRQRLTALCFCLHSICHCSLERLLTVAMHYTHTINYRQ